MRKAAATSLPLPAPTIATRSGFFLKLNGN